MKISNAKLANGNLVNIEITNGLISKVDNAIAGAVSDGIDAKSKLLIPGLVDLHTHLREPGREDAETVLTGSRSAVAGGYTAVSAMANTNPVADNAGVVEQIYRLGKSAGLVDVNPIGAVTKGLLGEQLAEMGAMADSIARVRIFSDDGKCVFDPLIMRRALEYVKTFNGIIAQHAQEPRLTVNAQMNEGIISARIGLPGWPAIAEEAIIARDILLAEHVQSRLHICHVTTAGGVELIRWAKQRGIQVTAEVTPHHLLLTDELVENYDPIYKVNPPLRTQKDVQALREGLAEGVIDIVATDHAPHPSEDKDCEFQAGASIAPARIAGYTNQGNQIAVGSSANLILVDVDRNWHVDRDKLKSKSKNTPFNGMELPSVITDVFHNGEQVLQDSQIVEKKSNNNE
ncbi:MAG: dihydroorotase [Actinobacteria bacterium]|nr:dihydroorotase [Actinomycetota bacterium]